MKIPKINFLKNKKSLVLIASGAIAFAALTASFPSIHNFYQKCKAKSLIDSAKKASISLVSSLDTSEFKIKEDSFVLTPEEKANIDKEMWDSKDKLKIINYGIENNLQIFNSKNYQKVILNLNEKARKKNNILEPTIIQTANSEKKDLDEKVIGFCDDKRGTRDSILRNELYLKARLKKPVGGLENPELAYIGEEFSKYVPNHSQKLEEKLKEFPSELNNSMGVALIRHKPLKEHIVEYGQTENVKKRAEEFFENAKTSYISGKNKNDSLTWYVAKEHDGKMNMQESKDLCNEQNTAINLIHAGDNSLNNLSNYFDEIHEQYYLLVTNNISKKKKFSHTKVVLKTETSIDSDGNLHTETVPDLEYYTTDGMQFYYILTKVTPNGSQSYEYYSGEKDSEDYWLDDWKSWDYKKNEKPGYLREWKRLHFDNSGNIYEKDIGTVNPHNLPLEKSCEKKFDEDF
ncbi:MAG: hypothetical protein ACP5OG_04105 [Candidatus Nanoarchaeia archaeon]